MINSETQTENTARNSIQKCLFKKQTTQSNVFYNYGDVFFVLIYLSLHNDNVITLTDLNTLM